MFLIINKDGIKIKCRCGCKEERIVEGICGKGFIWNPSYCNCECDKSCGIGEYVDHKNCKFRQKIAGELVEECGKNNDENEVIYNKTLNGIPLNDYKKVCGSCILCRVLFVIFLVIN